ncbi:MAG: hypothetical protein KDC12_06105 [Flavobacteriales bacterium]|nr:hypothetical protein [Flavobacteriales bacterium]
MIFFLHGWNLSAQFYRFSRYTVQDGLSQNTINDIFQDHDGYMWFATQDGLNRYNGHDFENFTTGSDPHHSISDNFLWGLAQDKQGRIWMGSRNGATGLNPRTGATIQLLVPPDQSKRTNSQVNNLWPGESALWIEYSWSTYRVPYADIEGVTGKYELKDSQKVTTPNAMVTATIPELDALFEGLGTELVTSTNEQILSQVAEAYMNRNLLSYGDEVWFVYDHALFCYHRMEDVLESKRFGTRPNGVYAIHRVASQGDIWVATLDGVYRGNGTDWSEVVENEGSLKGCFAHDIFVDRFGMVWIGTANQGLYHHDPRTTRFKTLDTSCGINHDLVWGIYWETDDSLWVGTDQGLSLVLLKPGHRLSEGMFASDAILKVVQHPLPQLKGMRVTTIYRDSKRTLWVGTSGNGLFALPRGNSRLVHVPLLSHVNASGQIADILEHKGMMWVATHGGVVAFRYSDPKSIEPEYTEQLNPFMNKYIMDLCPDQDGHMWIGSNVGISQMRLPEATCTNFNYDPDDRDHGPGFNFTSQLFDDHQGHMWLATFGGGVSRLDKSTGLFTHITEEQGMPNNVCSAIVSDQWGNAWVSTNKGIARLDLTTEKVHSYIFADGLPFNEFAMHSVGVSPSGEIAFGSPAGAVIFSADDITDSKEHAPILIQEVLINYEPMDRELDLTSALELFPGQEAVSFEIISLGYRKPDAIRYRYKLEGFNSDWIETNAMHRLISYTSLDAGEYTFLAQASNVDGQWDPNGLALHVVVLPPFYLRWWFVVTVSIIIGALIVYGVRYISQRKIKIELREAQEQQMIQKERERISRDLHDNVGSSLTYMISTLDALAYKLDRNNDDLGENVEELGEFARGTMSQLRESIWVMSQDEILLEEFKGRLADYLIKMVAPVQGLEQKLIFGQEQPTTLPPAWAINLFRICQELINNAVKHARASLILVQILQEGDHITVKVSDDGIGMREVTGVEGHFGLANLKSRANEMGAHFEIHSELGKGTSATLSLATNQKDD